MKDWQFTTFHVTQQTWRMKVTAGQICRNTAVNAWSHARLTSLNPHNGLYRMSLLNCIYQAYFQSTEHNLVPWAPAPHIPGHYAGLWRS